MTNMNSGYKGWSMSKRAAAAYSGGEMPKSKWTKAAMLSAIAEFCDDNDLFITPETSKLTKAQLFDRYFEWSSWHHTSRFCNATEFYKLNEKAVREDFAPMTDEQRAELDALKDAELKREEEECKRAAAERAAALDAVSAYRKAHGFAPNTCAAFALAHPELVTYRTSAKGNKVMCFEFNGCQYNVAMKDVDRHGVIGFDALEEM